MLAAGKAAGSMAEVAEDFYLDRLNCPERTPVRHCGGAARLRPADCGVVRMIEAGHPVPDAAGLEAADRALDLADGGGPNDLVLVLMSGGASANWIAPATAFRLRTNRR